MLYDLQVFDTRNLIVNLYLLLNLIFSRTFIAVVSYNRVRRKRKDEVALWASCYMRLLARRSEELAQNKFVYKE